MERRAFGDGAGAGREERIMAWSMHPGQRYDEARSRWHTPPPVEEGQTARVDAPKATALLVARDLDPSRPH